MIIMLKVMTAKLRGYGALQSDNSFYIIYLLKIN